MPGEYLTEQSQIQCPHGGIATLMTTNSKVTIMGARVLLESDIHVVTGCPFSTGPKYSPCVTIQWMSGSSRTGIQGGKPLLTSSIGLCKNAEGVIQGTAMIVNTQIYSTG
jgi:hypothetical protein